MNKTIALTEDTRGASFLEYIILCGLIAIMGIAAYGAFGQEISDKVTKYGETIGSLPDGGSSE